MPEITSLKFLFSNDVKVIIYELLLWNFFFFYLAHELILWKLYIIDCLLAVHVFPVSW